MSSKKTKRMACKFFDVNPVDAATNDALGRCSDTDDSCLQMAAIGKNTNGGWDLMQLEMLLPA